MKNANLVSLSWRVLSSSRHRHKRPLVFTSRILASGTGPGVGPGARLSTPLAVRAAALCTPGRDAGSVRAGRDRTGRPALVDVVLDVQGLEVAGLRPGDVLPLARLRVG